MLRSVLWLLILAALVYAVFWVLDKRSSRGDGNGGGGGVRPKGTPPPRGPMGPDDDEDFLRQLERKRRHGKGPAESS